jgi:serine/threonine protein kinase
VPDVAPRQSCPNCGRVHDVSVYVSGQRLLCPCGLHFVVSRSDVRRGPGAAASADGRAARLPSPRIGGGRAPEAEGATRLAAPPRISGYELLELIGRGGMGEVYRARQLSLGREVAVKVLAGELAGDPELVRRFAKEAAALAALAHPGIVQVIDRGPSAPEGLVFYAMELCEGESLREMLGRGPLALPKAAALVGQVAEAMGHAHARGVVHRDLKPENVLVDAAGRAKVVDFGLAGVRSERPELALTRPATAMGTAHYMAPEQLRDARGVDARADVYSLGVMLYECLTGELPAGRFQLPSGRVPGLSSRLDAVAAKALAQDPGERYPDAGAMARAMEEASAPRPRARRKAPMARGRQPNGRARALAVALALAALGALALRPACRSAEVGQRLTKPAEAGQSRGGDESRRSPSIPQPLAPSPLAERRKGERLF